MRLRSRAKRAVNTDPLHGRRDADAPLSAEHDDSLVRADVCCVLLEERERLDLARRRRRVSALPVPSDKAGVHAPPPRRLRLDPDVAAHGCCRDVPVCPCPRLIAQPLDVPQRRDVLAVVRVVVSGSSVGVEFAVVSGCDAHRRAAGESGMRSGRAQSLVCCS